MKYKSDKHAFKYDPAVLAYTTRRIRELKGESYTAPIHEPPHPYIRKRLDEIKSQYDKD